MSRVVTPKNCDTSVKKAIQQLAKQLAVSAEPTFASLTLTDLTQGSVLFAGASGILSQDNSNLFWDSSNIRLGIGIATPLVKGHFLEDTDATGVIVENTSGTQDLTLLKLYNNKTAAAGDRIRVAFHAKNSTGSDKKYGEYGMYVYDKTAGSENGSFTMNVLSDGSLRQFYTARGGLENVFNDGSEDINFRVESDNLSYAFFVEGSSGNIGFGAWIPETLTEWRSTVPYLTLHNSTHEDLDGGRESRFIFKGEQSGEEETTLAMIEVGHDGSADDEKGYADFFINDGDDGDSPTKRLRIDSVGLNLTGSLTVSTIAAEGSDVNKFLVDSSGIIKYRTGAQVLSDIGAQPLDAELTSLAALSYVAVSFVKMTGANTFALRTIGETADDLEATIDHDQLANGGAHDYAYVSGNDGATGITAAELEELSDGSETTLHSHAGGGEITNLDGGVSSSDYTVIDMSPIDGGDST